MTFRSLLVGCLVIALGSNLLSPQPVSAGGAASIGNRLVIVTYWGDDRVALIDLNGQPGQEEIWNIDVLQSHGCSKPYDVKVESRSRYAYVTCSASDTILVIDIVAQLASHTIPTGNGPRDIWLTADGERAVVANSGEDTVSVISLAERRVLYKVEVGLQPYGVALTENDSLAIVTGWASGDVHFIELGQTSGRIVARAPVGLLPYTVVVPPGDTTAYVTVNGSHRVVALDVPGRRVAQSIEVGRNPWGAAPSADGMTLLVSNNRSNDVSILRHQGVRSPGSILSEDRRVTLGMGGRSGAPASVSAKAKNASISLDGTRGVLTDIGNNELVVIDMQNGTKVRTISTGRAPYGLEFIR